MKLKKSILLFSTFIFALLAVVSCEDNTSASSSLKNYIGLESKKTIRVEADATLVSQAKVYASNKSSSDRVISIYVDAAATTLGSAYYSVPATVTIPANSLEGVFDVSITATDLDAGNKLVIKITPETWFNIATDFDINNAQGAIKDETSVVRGSKLVIDVVELCNANPFTVEIVTDRYGSETSWELYDSAFNVIASGGPFTDQSAAGAYAVGPEQFCLPNGDYTFIIYDQYSDGMNTGYGAGYYRLVKYSATGQEIEIAKNGVFGDSEIVEFSLP